MGGASIPYLLGTEIPTAALREKTQAVGTTWNVVWAFVTNYVIPYMISSIHFKVGWVFGGISALALVFTFFFLPETKVSLASCAATLITVKLTPCACVEQGRALEEVDAIFEVGFNPFRPERVPLTDAERRVGQLEGEKEVSSMVGHNEVSSADNRPGVAV